MVSGRRGAISNPTAQLGPVFADGLHEGGIPVDFFVAVGFALAAERVEVFAQSGVPALCCPIPHALRDLEVSRDLGFPVFRFRLGGCRRLRRGLAPNQLISESGIRNRRIRGFSTVRLW